MLLAVASVSFVGIGMVTAVLPLISPEKGAQLGFIAQGLLLVVSGVYYPVDGDAAVDAVDRDDLAGDLRAARDPGRGPRRRRPRRACGATCGRCSCSASVSIPLGLAVFRAGERYAKRHGKLKRSG